MTEAEWQSLLGAVQEIQDWFPEGLAFIEGIATYAHTASNEETKALAAQSHDADFVIALPDFADLRDIEVLTSNRRLGKQQFVKNGFEFDVYVEGQTDLVVPVDEAIAASVMRTGIRVACCEHLLILKAKALQDRRRTPKGDKDEDDVVRLLVASHDMNKTLLVRLTEDLLAEIESAVRGDASLRLAGGNHHFAHRLRSGAEGRLDEVRRAFRDNYDDSVSPP